MRGLYSTLHIYLSKSNAKVLSQDTGSEGNLEEGGINGVVEGHAQQLGQGVGQGSSKLFFFISITALFWVFSTFSLTL